MKIQEEVSVVNDSEEAEENLFDDEEDLFA